MTLIGGLAQVAKKYSWKILLVMLLLASNLQAKPEIIDWKVLSDTSNRAYLFIDSNDTMYVEVIGREDFLRLNNKWVKTDQYGSFLNGFVKNGSVHLTFLKGKQNIDIYSVGKDLTLENRISIGDFRDYPGSIERVIYVPGDSNVYYLLGSRNQVPQEGFEFLWAPLNTGHGTFYTKPVLAEIRGQKTLKYEKFSYGGKTDESYRIKEVLTGKDRIHFLGFRTQKQLATRTKQLCPDILYYAEYNVKSKKVEQTQDIYERLPYFVPNNNLGHFSWHMSAASFNNNLFLVFSWHGIHLFSKSTEIKIENINMPICYSQSDGNAFSKAEVIGQGILPLARIDSLGNVHVIWSNSNGDFVHRAKKDGRWCDEQIILDKVIDTGEVWEGMRQGEWYLQNMCAEFDKDNNLNVVFTSKGKLVYAKIRVN